MLFLSWSMVPIFSQDRIRSELNTTKGLLSLTKTYFLTAFGRSRYAVVAGGQARCITIATGLLRLLGSITSWVVVFPRTVLTGGVMIMQQAAKQGSRLIATERISQADVCLSHNFKCSIFFDLLALISLFTFILFKSKRMPNAEELVHLPNACSRLCVWGMLL
jgi:hypothetical protein